MGCEVCLGILTAQPTRSRRVVLISWSRRSDDHLCSKPILNLKLNLNLKLAYEEEESVCKLDQEVRNVCVRERQSSSIAKHFSFFAV